MPHPARRDRRLSIPSTLVRAAILAAALAVSLLAPPAARADTVDDLLFDLQFVPHDARLARAFGLTDLGGRSVSLGQQRGKVVLIYFWTST